MRKADIEMLMGPRATLSEGTYAARGFNLFTTFGALWVDLFAVLHMRLSPTPAVLTDLSFFASFPPYSLANRKMAAFPIACRSGLPHEGYEVVATVRCELLNVLVCEADRRSRGGDVEVSV
jgi:hypothetical protein